MYGSCNKTPFRTEQKMNLRTNTTLLQQNTTISLNISLKYFRKEFLVANGPSNQIGIRGFRS